MLTKDDVKKIAQLSRIQLTDLELEKYTSDLSTVLDYVEALKALDVSKLEEVSQVTGLVNVQREDVPVLSEYRDEILATVPDTKDGYVKVKAIL